MRSTVITLTLLGTLCALPLFAGAATDVVTGAREAGSGKATGRMNGLPEGAQRPEVRMMATGTKTVPPRMEEARERMQEKRSEIFKRYAGLMVKRMNAMIDRLSGLADRLDSRVAKEKLRGVDTSKTEANLVTVRTKLAEATAAVAEAQSAVTGALALAEANDTETKPVDAGKPVREALNKAKTAVFAAHKALVNAITSLKGERERVTATTTNAAGEAL